MELIRFNAVRKDFYTRQKTRRVTALDGIRLSLFEGEILGLIGESGSGKTTLARTLAGVVKPDSGTIIFRGKSLGTGKSIFRGTGKPAIQMIFQDPNSTFNPRLRISTSLKEGLDNLGIRGKSASERIEKVLDAVGISSGDSGRYPFEFSGGQKQRLALARALLVEPECLVLDEPVSSLDVSIQARILNLLQEIKEKFRLTYLFIGHDLNVIAYIGTRIAVMHRGRIVETAKTEELIQEPKHPYSIALLDPVKRKSSDSGHDWERNAASGSEGCHFRFSCRAADDKCKLPVPFAPFDTEGNGILCHHPEKLYTGSRP